jgi:hypothetical protein
MKMPKNRSISMLSGLEIGSAMTLEPLPHPPTIWLNYSTYTPPLGFASTQFSPTGLQSSSSRQLALPLTSASSSTLCLLAPNPRSRRWLTWSTLYALRPPLVRLLPLAAPATPKPLPDLFRELPMLSPTPQAYAGLVDNPTSSPLTSVRGNDPSPPIPIPTRTLPRLPPLPLAYPNPLRLRKRGAPLPPRLALSKWCGRTKFRLRETVAGRLRTRTRLLRGERVFYEVLDNESLGV